MTVNYKEVFYEGIKPYCKAKSIKVLDVNFEEQTMEIMSLETGEVTTESMDTFAEDFNKTNIR